MSDWRARAKPVEPGSDWKSRSVPVTIEGPPPAPKRGFTTVDTEGEEPAPEPGWFENAAETIANPKGSLGAAATGFNEGTSMGFSDEAMGLGDAYLKGTERLHQKLGFVDTPPYDPSGHVDDEQPGILDSAKTAYANTRDQERARQATAHAEHPKIAGASELAGMIAMPLPGPGKVKGLAGVGKMALQGAGLNALSEAGHGGPGFDLKDAAKRTLIAAGGGGLGGVVSNMFGSLASRFGRNAAKAEGDAAEMASKEISDAIGSQQGKYRSSISNANRDLDVMERVAASLPEGDPDKLKLLEYLSSQEADQLRRSIATNKLGTAPERIAEMGTEKSALEALKASQTADVASRTTDILNPVKATLKNTKLLKHLANKAAPAMIGMASPGAGAAASLAAGHIGTKIANVFKHPGVRKMYWNSLQKAVAVPERAAQLGKYAPLLMNMYREKGEDGLMAMDQALLESDEKYQALRQAMVDAETEKEGAQ